MLYLLMLNWHLEEPGFKTPSLFYLAKGYWGCLSLTSSEACFFGQERYL